MIAEHENSKSIYLVSVLVAFSWVGLFVLLASIVCGVTGCSDNSEAILLGSLLFIACLALVSTAIGSSIRCNKCGERLFRQKIGPKHEKATRYPLLDYWSSMVVECLRSKKITCMNCGTSYSCKYR